MLVFEIKGSRVFSGNLGYLFDKGYFKDSNCIFTLRDDENTSIEGNFTFDVYTYYYACNQSGRRFGPEDVDTVYIFTEDFSDHVFTNDELVGYGIANYEKLVESYRVNTSASEAYFDSRKLNALERELEEVKKENNEYLRKFSELSREMGYLGTDGTSKKQSTLDIVLDEATGNSQTSSKADVVDFQDSARSYNEAKYILGQMVKDHLDNGRQIVSSGIVPDNEYGKYQVYTLGV